MKTYFYAKAITYQNILDLIASYTLDFPDTETGGDIFGFWTHTGCPIVQVITGPGENAHRSVVSFHQDINYLKSIHAVLHERHGMQHLGAWHSHHILDLAKPSGYDIETAIAGLHQSNLERLFIIISNIREERIDINGFLFRQKEKVPYIPLPWIVSHHENPYYADKALDELIKAPVTDEIKSILVTNFSF